MNNIYHGNDTNSTNTTNENEKDNGNGGIPEVSDRKLWKKKKQNNCKEIINRSNNINGNNTNQKNVYFLADSIAKKLNCYLLTKKIRHKHLVKVCSFSRAKINCKTDHVKPTLREVNPDHIISNAGTNHLRNNKTAS